MADFVKLVEDRKKSAAKNNSKLSDISDFEDSELQEDADSSSDDDFYELSDQENKWSLKYLLMLKE